MSGASSLLRLSVLSAAAVVFVSAGMARAGDMPVKAPARVGCAQAVDGVNGKIGGWGGSFANKTIYGSTGSIAMPLGCEFGAQLDATGASFDGRFLGSLGGHLFWRDPSKGLLGAYGSYTHWNSAGGVTANHIGPEAEVYYGRFTVQGVAGVEFGNSTSETIGSLIQSYDVKTRFFDQVNVAYYLQDDLKVFAGHRYLGGKHALALGGEWGLPMSHGVMAALFAEARFGQSDFHGVWGGLRFYFGQKDKSLIDRHRQDDPIDWGNGFGISNSGSTSPAAPTCVAPRVIISGVCQMPPV